MKRLFGFMVLCGIVLAMVTAGGIDSDMIDMERVLVQSLLSAVLISAGGMMLTRSA